MTAAARALVCTSILAASVANATPLEESHLGGVVFVGPTSPSVSALYWNPAAASLMKGFHLYLGGGAKVDWTKVSRDTIDTSDGEPSSNGDLSFPSQSGTAITPNEFSGFIWDLGVDRVTLGVSFSTPYADQIADGTNKNVGYHATGGFFYGTAMTISTSFRVNGTLAIGGGLSFLASHVDLEFNRDTALEACSVRPCHVENPATTEHYALNTDWDLNPFSKSLTFNLGILLHIESWIIGVSFLSPISEAKDANAVVTQPGAPDAPVDGGVRVSFRLPIIVNAGVRRRLFGDYDLLVNARFENWAAHQLWDLRFYGNQLRNANVPDWIERYRGFQDVYALEAGLENQPQSLLRLGTRLSFESSAVPASSVAWDQVDGPKLELAGGAQVHLVGGWSLVVGAVLTGMLPTNTGAPADFSPSAFINCNASGQDLDVCAPVREGRALPTNAGTYTRLSGEVTLGLAFDTW